MTMLSITEERSYVATALRLPRKDIRSTCQSYARTRKFWLMQDSMRKILSREQGPDPELRAKVGTGGR
jgi:hypothetical protein